MEKHKEEINKIFKELEKEIDMQDLKIKANAYGTHFSSDYLLELRDEYYENFGRRNALNIIRARINELMEEE